jgi:hypothetical protein
LHVAQPLIAQLRDDVEPESPGQVAQGTWLVPPAIAVPGPAVFGLGDELLDDGGDQRLLARRRVRFRLRG